MILKIPPGSRRSVIEATIGSLLATATFQNAYAMSPRAYEIPDRLDGECSQERAIPLRINARLRRIIQDFGFDPLYASYLMHFVFSSLALYVKSKPNSFADDELVAFSEVAVRNALRHFSDLPHSCVSLKLPGTNLTAEMASILSSIDTMVPHPAFLSSPMHKQATAPTFPSWQTIENRPALRPDWGERPVLPDPLHIEFDDPPPLFSERFDVALDEVRECNENPTPSSRNTALFWNDAIGSTTPIGHWNAIACAILADKRVGIERAIWFFDVLNKIMYVCGIYCWKCKFQYLYPRPIQFFRLKKTIIKTPNFPSYPSGHSCFSAGAAHFIGSQFAELAASAKEMALDASESRILGGVHFRFDCEAGVSLGDGIAKQLVGAL
jgi:PAP2 superfamily protein